MRATPSVIVVLRLAACYLAFAVAASAAPLNVFAAASLSDVLQELAPKFEAATGEKLRFNFGGSGTLVRQIEEGAPADLFISADESRLQRLQAAGLVAPGSRREMVRNALVVVVPDGVTVSRVAELTRAEIAHIAIGDPATVPAGTYAKTYLSRIHLWNSLTSKLVPLENVRAVLAAVETGNADAGFVYRTDALASKKVRVAIEIAGSDAPQITYPLAVLNNSPRIAAALKLADFLVSAEAQAVFARYGFLPPGPEPR